MKSVAEATGKALNVVTQFSPVVLVNRLLTVKRQLREAQEELREQQTSLIRQGRTQAASGGLAEAKGTGKLLFRQDPEAKETTRFFFSSRRRHTRWNCDWSSDVCSSD